MNEFPTKPKENAPHEVGHYLNLGGPGRNRPGLRMPDPASRLLPAEI